VALGELPHQSLNHDQGASRVKWNSVKTVHFSRDLWKRKEWNGKEENLLLDYLQSLVAFDYPSNGGDADRIQRIPRDIKLG